MLKNQRPEPPISKTKTPQLACAVTTDRVHSQSQHEASKPQAARSTASQSRLGNPAKGQPRQTMPGMICNFCETRILMRKSSSLISSRTAGWRSGSAGALQAQGHRFKSCTGHHKQRSRRISVGFFFSLVKAVDPALIIQFVCNPKCQSGGKRRSV